MLNDCHMWLRCEGGMASYKWATANNACEHLRFESTEGNSVREWEKWADAVSKVYLRNQVLALPHVSSMEAAKACARQGWSKECTQRVFEQNPRARAELHARATARRHDARAAQGADAVAHRALSHVAFLRERR